MSNNRIRRVVLLCASFSRNLAFYRALHERRALFDTNHPHASFWRQAYANFIYTAVLDWCKLFGENKSKYHWRKFVSKPDEFEQSLLHAIQADANGFAECITSMRRYRDKFVAHLDDEPVMHIPVLRTAQKAVVFYHTHIVSTEAEAGDLIGLPDTIEKMEQGFQQCSTQAESLFASYH